MLATNCAPRYSYQYSTGPKVTVKDNWTKADHAYMTVLIFMSGGLLLKLKD